MGQDAGEHFAEPGIDHGHHGDDRKDPTQGPAGRFDAEQEKDRTHGQFVPGRAHAASADLLEPGGKNIGAQGQCRAGHQVSVPGDFQFLFLIEPIVKKDHHQGKGDMGDPLIHGGELKDAGIELIEAHGNGDEPDQHGNLRFRLFGFNIHGACNPCSVRRHFVPAGRLV